MVASEFIARNFHLKSNDIEPFRFIAALTNSGKNSSLGISLSLPLLQAKGGF